MNYSVGIKPGKARKRFDEWRALNMFPNVKS